jgi:UDP-4-amino-4,6-dideoxy-N-acetyl-beta-L-altrosamine N-acetyltransferase
MQSVNAIDDTRQSQDCLRRMTAVDLESVFELRNHPEVRRYMLTRHEISADEHRSWFERASQNRRVELLVFQMEKVCRGFVQFKDTDYQGVVDWGFYVAPDAPKGTGKKLGLAALDYVFKKAELHKICGQALHWNQPSIKFHRSLGFIQEGVLRHHHFDGSVYHDLICFGMLKSEWVASELQAGRNE